MDQKGPYEPRQPVISQDPPTDAEISATANLTDFLIKVGDILSPEEKGHRDSVFERLGHIITEFGRDCAAKSGQDVENAGSSCGFLAPFGSYSLDVSNPNSDIDTVCMVPRFIKRTDFFTVLYKMLLNHTLVRDLRKVEKARVPIMKMVFDGVDVDISFAQLANSVVDQSLYEHIEDDAIIGDVDEASKDSLNGVRTTNMILKLVPNIKTFQTVVRFMRVWSKARGIYGNVYGYLGGINCALLCAFVCQRYPRATASSLILFLFQDLAEWNWPEPIYINTPSTGPKLSWDNSVGSPGKRDLMPVITPAYPAMNSLANVTKSSRARMTMEFRRGYKLAKKIILEGEDWAILTVRPRFFTTYRKYVQVLVWADTQDVFSEWISTVESRIRKLGQRLELVRFMKGAYVWPEYFERKDDEGHEFAACFFIGIDYEIPEEENVVRSIDLSEPCQNFMEMMYDKRLRTEQMHMFIRLVNRNDLPDYLFPEGRKRKT